MQNCAASNLKRVSLELGGKSPLVIFSDAPDGKNFLFYNFMKWKLNTFIAFSVDEAVKIAHEALFSNHGQSCCAGSRTFVQDTIYDEFVKKAADLAKKRVVGDPFTKGTQQGPQVSFQKFLFPSLNGSDFLKRCFFFFCILD